MKAAVLFVAIALSFIGATVLIPSCTHVGTQAVSHPGQINAFDGAAYDTLTVAQASILQAKTLAPQFPQYKTALNEAVAAYNAALAAYKTYHLSGSASADTGAIHAQLTALTAQVAQLLKSFGVTPQ